MPSPSPEIILQQLIDYCDASAVELLRLKDQVSKLIEVKQRVVKDNSGGALLRMKEEALRTIDNMQKINSVLDPSIERIKVILEQASSGPREVSLKRKILAPTPFPEGEIK